MAIKMGIPNWTVSTASSQTEFPLSSDENDSTFFLAPTRGVVSVDPFSGSGMTYTLTLSFLSMNSLNVAPTKKDLCEHPPVVKRRCKNSEKSQETAMTANAAKRKR
jgi:hypothetical protein